MFRNVLLDLNYTLVANSSQMSRKGNEFRKNYERYRGWLVDLIRALNPERVILLTVRIESDKHWTLANIKRHLNWQPDVAIFNTQGYHVGPPAWKEYALNNIIFPEYGNDPSDYIAFESNQETHAMMAKYGIKCLKACPHSEAEVMDGVNREIQSGRGVQRLF